MLASIVALFFVLNVERGRDRRRRCASDDGDHDFSDESVPSEASEEVLHLVVCTDMVWFRMTWQKSSFYECVRKIGVEQEIANFQVVAFFGELEDFVAAMHEDAFACRR